MIGSEPAACAAQMLFFVKAMKANSAHTATNETTKMLNMANPCGVLESRRQLDSFKGMNVHLYQETTAGRTKLLCLTPDSVPAGLDRPANQGFIQRNELQDMIPRHGNQRTERQGEEKD